MTSSVQRNGRGWLGALAVCVAAVGAGGAHAEDPQKIAASVCIACHGDQGNSMVPMFPKLAGLQAEYIDKQLRDFLSGKRKSDLMGPALANISEGDVAGLAAYYAGQTPAKGEPKDAQKTAAGKLLYDDGNTESGVPACVGCHQAAGAGNERYPRLAGQHADYISQQMQQFRSGARANDKGKVMRAVASRLTDKEIADLAEYLSGL